jgi:hypothetical protein
MSYRSASPEKPARRSLEEAVKTRIGSSRAASPGPSHPRGPNFLVDGAPCLPVDSPVEWFKARGKGQFLLLEQGFPLKFVLGLIL